MLVISLTLSLSLSLSLSFSLSFSLSLSLSSLVVEFEIMNVMEVNSTSVTLLVCEGCGAQLSRNLSQNWLNKWGGGGVIFGFRRKINKVQAVGL